MTKASSGEEILLYKNVAEQEERRMSDLSDWASSVTSTAEIQVHEGSRTNKIVDYGYWTLVHILKRDSKRDNDFVFLLLVLHFHIFLFISWITQMNTLAIEQDIYNLKRDCEDKDATIKELTTLLHSSDIAGSKVMF